MNGGSGPIKWWQLRRHYRLRRFFRDMRRLAREFDVQEGGDN